ncbi:hypothetical protein RF11_09398 [Thelohanellus kitauei]|uniref:Uncharacterized protein n=1 Tax=Thelohanellus kitauei TaxID=669202 RepID=A0A0C2NDD3_THEKT|nr:hypothetical protein RF11_09398 [Thelohanellus kitauei]
MYTKASSEQSLYFGYRSYSSYTLYNDGNNLTTYDSYNPHKTVQRIRVDLNPEWIMSRGFDIGYFIQPWHESILLAFSDPHEHARRLIFYTFWKFVTIEAEQVSIIDNFIREAFSSFGHKILKLDLNGDFRPDFLVSSPTSSWLDLPAVGHVEIFISRKSYPPFVHNPIFLRGNLIPLSYFGFDLVDSIDLNGDDVNGNCI